MAKRRKVTEEDEKYILDNLDQEVEQLSDDLDLSESSINTFISSIEDEVEEEEPKEPKVELNKKTFVLDQTASEMLDDIIKNKKAKVVKDPNIHVIRPK